MLNKVKSKKLYEQVADQIIHKILQGQYLKDTLLPSETELIRMTGVSRITVREALKSLAAVGIIETHRGKGSYVLVNAEELLGDVSGRGQREKYREAFLESSRARVLLEPLAAQHMALTAGEEQLAELERVADAARPSRLLEVSDRFHEIIMRSLNNSLLMEFFESLLTLESLKPDMHIIDPGAQANVSAELTRQHKKIAKAIRERNGEFAYLYMKEHCLYILKVYEEYFDQFYLPSLSED